MFTSSYFYKSGMMPLSIIDFKPHHRIINRHDYLNFNAIPILN